MTGGEGRGTKKRLRVLLLVEACNPELRTAWLIGWTLAEALGKLVDTHIVTESDNRDAIVRAGLVEGRDFTIIDTTALKAARDRIRVAVFRDPERGWGAWQAMSLPASYQFEHRAWKRFRHDLAAGGYDLVHRISPISPDQPSLIARHLRKLGIPFVVGPLNGGLPWPKAFAETRRKEGEWVSYLRGLVRRIPGYVATRENASALLIGSRDVLARTSPKYHGKCVYIPENAVDPRRFSAVRMPKSDSTLRAIYVGRLVPYKGVDMLLEAAAPLLQSERMTLEILGDGPLRPALEQRVSELGVGRSVAVLGNVDHKAVQEYLARADIFCAPAIREFGGAVVMEAMYMGTVPVVVDYGGPPEYATPDCGFAIPLADRDGIVRKLGTLLNDIAADPDQLVALGKRAAAKARTLFQWDVKARMILEVYRWTLDPGMPKPDFGIPLDRAPAIGEDAIGEDAIGEDAIGEDTRGREEGPGPPGLAPGLDRAC